MLKKIIFTTIVTLTTLLHSHPVDLVIFSCDRPLQLYALLESLEYHVTGVNHTAIVCKATTDAYKKAYLQVNQRFPHVCFNYEGSNLHEDFRSVFMKSSFECSSDYISFIVDDLLVIDTVDLSYCTHLMEKTDAYSFHLRLGKNVTYCFMGKMASPVPPHQHVIDDVYLFNFNEGIGDWGYASSLDMALYRKKDIQSILETIPHLSMHFENDWNMRTKNNQRGLFFEHPKTINVTTNVSHPIEEGQNLNQFSSTWRETKLAEYSTLNLLNQFNKGLKIDITPFANIQSNTVHIEHDYTYLPRNS